MNEETVRARPAWNYRALLLALFGAILLQVTILPCLCREGAVRAEMALGIDLLVVGRMIVACKRKERGKGWIFYAMLPFAIIPVAMLLTCETGAGPADASAPDRNAPPVTTRADQWSRDELAEAASDSVSGTIPGTDVKIVRWRVLWNPKRSFSAERAILLICWSEDGGSRWRLARVYRHPGMPRPPPAWRQYALVDAPFVSRRDFLAPPSREEILQFLEDSDWNRVSPDFEVVDGDSCSLRNDDLRTQAAEHQAARED